MANSKKKKSAKPKAVAKTKAVAKPKAAAKTKAVAKPKAAAKTKSVAAKKPASKKAPAKKPAAVKTPAKSNKPKKANRNGTVNGKVAKAQNSVLSAVKKDTGAASLSPFQRKQRVKLLTLRDAVLDSMLGVAKDNLRSRAEGSEASAFGMHQADAGSDAYDRDFALNLLSQEQDALYEIDEAIKRLDAGTYGVCEMSGKSIPHARLDAIPFARFTVECQSQIERQNKLIRMRQPVTSLFGLTDDDSDGDDDDSSSDNKD